MSREILLATSTIKEYEAVILVYSEDISWVNNIPGVDYTKDSITIYNKCEANISFPTKCSGCVIKPLSNLGYLGGTYLHHIIENYKSGTLANRNLFFQGNPFDSIFNLEYFEY